MGDREDAGSGRQEDLKVLAFGSVEQRAAVELRRRVLRLPLGLDFSDQELEAEVEQIHFGFLVDGAVVSCLTLVPHGAEVKMRQVATDPDWQGKGLGARLVEFSEGWAVQHGFSCMVLHAREPAVPFYLKLGYRVVGERFSEVGLPHLRMEKALNS